MFFILFWCDYGRVILFYTLFKWTEYTVLNIILFEKLKFKPFDFNQSTGVNGRVSAPIKGEVAVFAPFILLLCIMIRSVSPHQNPPTPAAQVGGRCAVPA